jgi:hypothetical protein
MNANIADPWERLGWRFIGVLATLIILVSFWMASEKAIRSIVAFGALISKHANFRYRIGMPV